MDENADDGPTHSPEQNEPVPEQLADHPGRTLSVDAHGRDTTHAGRRWQDGPVSRAQPSGSLQVAPRRLGCVLLTLRLALASCGIFPPRPNPEPDRKTADQAAAALAAGLTAKDLSALPFRNASGAAINDQFQPLIAGMGPLKPGVTVASVSRDGSSATASLLFTWTFPGVPERWTYPTEVKLAEESGQWKTSWHPSILHAQLDGTNRLSQRRLHPERGELLGEDGAPIV